MGDREPYRQLMEQLHLDPMRCRLNGSLPDVREAYLSSSVFVLPSRFEGFGLVIIEAMSCGLPVVTFDCENGPRSIISDGKDGFLMPPFDVDAFAQRLIALTNDGELRRKIGAEARQSSSRYEIEKIALMWKKLFEEVCGYEEL
jgi:glycosyltransferase involved in cell wall biosynthesis